MQFKLFTMGLGILIGAVLLSGVINNFLSAVCVFAAVVCWFALEKSRGGTIVGIVAVLGWLFVAAVIAAAFRQP